MSRNRVQITKLFEYLVEANCQNRSQCQCCNHNILRISVTILQICNQFHKILGTQTVWRNSLHLNTFLQDLKIIHTYIKSTRDRKKYCVLHQIEVFQTHSIVSGELSCYDNQKGHGVSSGCQWHVGCKHGIYSDKPPTV